MKAFALTGLLILCSQSYAHAWGDEGHRITGYIANPLLSATTRQQLRALVGTDDLAQVATWMDDERDTLNRTLRGSSRWHYENRAACSATTDTARACPQGQCITRQIERYLRVLQNRDATVTQRGTAVRILVHLLGDLHQPLHLIDHYDRGGNDLLVRLPREKEPRRLHAVWDTQLVRMNLGHDTETTYAQALREQFANQRAAVQNGTIEQWANETHALGQHVYDTLPQFSCNIASGSATQVTRLPVAYIEAGQSQVDSQLAKAGVRIAAVLNRALSNP